MRKQTIDPRIGSYSAARSRRNSARGASAPDQMVGIHSSRVMSQSLPWMAQKPGYLRNTISISTWYLFHLRALSPRRCSAATPR